jgi:hypothetical protein
LRIRPRTSRASCDNADHQRDAHSVVDRLEVDVENQQREFLIGAIRAFDFSAICRS